MSKVGLSVCYDTRNYGSQLQVLATVRAIERLGYETEIIRYEKRLTPRFVLQQVPRVFNPYFIRGKVRRMRRQRQIAAHPEVAAQVRQRNQRFAQFVEHYLPNLSVPYCGWETLVREAGARYDLFLCGSDQLWLPSNLESHYYTLEFAPDNKSKVAYATSYGVDQIPWYQRRRTARYLNRFQALSTRELAGAEIIRSLTGRVAPVVCDPTLLFDGAAWGEILPARRVLEGSYVFCYLLGADPEHRRAARAFADRMGLRLVTCPFLDNYVEEDRTFGDVQMFDADAADWVNLIRYADYVLTDSFHGSVFSILHHRPFLTFNRFRAGADSRNSRIDSLCALLGLEDRRYTGDVMAVCKAVDYAAVDARLEGLRASSLAYLRDALAGRQDAAGCAEI